MRTNNIWGQIRWDNILLTDKRNANLTFNTIYDTAEEILARHMANRKLTKKEETRNILTIYK